MSMFTNYNNTPNSYIPDNLSPQQPPFIPYPPKTPYVTYNAKGEAIGYEWSYNDNIILNFNVSGRVLYSPAGDNSYNESIATYMNTGNQRFVFRIYNSRYELIYEAKPDFKNNANGSVSIPVIIYDTLASALVKGKYKLSLAIEGTCEDPLSETTLQIRQTILSPDNCTVCIK